MEQRDRQISPKVSDTFIALAAKVQMRRTVTEVRFMSVVQAIGGAAAALRKGGFAGVRDAAARYERDEWAGEHTVHLRFRGNDAAAVVDLRQHLNSSLAGDFTTFDAVVIALLATLDNDTAAERA